MRRSRKEAKTKSTILQRYATFGLRPKDAISSRPLRYLLIHIHAVLHLSLFPYSCHKSLKFQQQNVGYASLLLGFGLDRLTCSVQWEIRCHTRGLEMHQLCFGPFCDDSALTMRPASLVLLQILRMNTGHQSSDLAESVKCMPLQYGAVCYAAVAN